jgi:hypothetical protein
VRVGREAAHVGSDLGQQHLGGAAVDAGDGVEQLDLTRERRVSSSVRSESVWIVSSRKSIWPSIWETSSAWWPLSGPAAPRAARGSSCAACPWTHTPGQVPTTLPGVTVVRAAAFSTYPLPIERWPTPEQLYPATGLAPAT